jgi:hypothetical protein
MFEARGERFCGILVENFQGAFFVSLFGLF